MTVILDADTWSCLCWVDGLFLDFCCCLWFLGGCGSCGLTHRKFFWAPARCDHGIPGRVCFRYCELTHRNEYGLDRRAVGFTEDRKAGHPIRICLVSWERGQRVKRDHSRWSTIELGMRLRVGSAGEEGDWRSEAHHLFHWPTCFLGQRVPKECLWKLLTERKGWGSERSKNSYQIFSK